MARLIWHWFQPSEVFIGRKVAMATHQDGSHHPEPWLHCLWGLVRIEADPHGGDKAPSFGFWPKSLSNRFYIILFTLTKFLELRTTQSDHLLEGKWMEKSFYYIYIKIESRSRVNPTQQKKKKQNWEQNEYTKGWDRLQVNVGLPFSLICMVFFSLGFTSL